MALKSCVLVPYCPLPVNTGAKAEMWRHLQLLRQLGPCLVVSAKTKPVGAGWTDEAVETFRREGFELRFREDSCRRSVSQSVGIAYAAFYKVLGLDRAFGHSNPYHRCAFPVDWWRECVEGADVAVINYSYWAWLPCSCRKVVVLLDLLSTHMWEGSDKETKDLATADSVMVISKDEETALLGVGMSRIVWAPPAVEAHECPPSEAIGLVGSASRFNEEGLNWLKAGTAPEKSIRVYGGLAVSAKGTMFNPVGRYDSTYQPYEECGVVLMTTVLGMGVQIKSIEALACGRAIVARRGAMRGIPSGHGAWIEVDTPQQMIAEAERLSRDEAARRQLSSAAGAYYKRFLDAAMVNSRIAAVMTGSTETDTAKG